MNVLGFFLTFFGIVLLLFGACVCWLFRGGLGPDSIESSGWEAVELFMSGFWVYLPVSFPLIVVGAYLWVRKQEN